MVGGAGEAAREARPILLGALDLAAAAAAAAAAAPPAARAEPNCARHPLVDGALESGAEELLVVDARRVAAAGADLAGEAGLVEGRAEAQPVARRDRLDLARRARDLDLVVGEESLEAPLLGDAGRCSAPSLESLRLAQRAVDDVGVGRPERAAGGAELVAEDLDAPYVEAQGSADIAARENVAQEREVADEVLVLDLEQEGAVLLVRLDAEEGVISLLDGDDVAEVLLEQRGKN